MKGKTPNTESMLRRQELPCSWNWREISFEIETYRDREENVKQKSDLCRSLGLLGNKSVLFRHDTIGLLFF